MIKVEASPEFFEGILTKGFKFEIIRGLPKNTKLEHVVVGIQTGTITMFFDDGKDEPQSIMIEARTIDEYKETQTEN